MEETFNTATLLRCSSFFNSNNNDPKMNSVGSHDYKLWCKGSRNLSASCYCVQQRRSCNAIMHTRTMVACICNLQSSINSFTCEYVPGQTCWVSKKWFKCACSEVPGKPGDVSLQIFVVSPRLGRVLEGVFNKLRSSKKIANDETFEATKKTGRTWKWSSDKENWQDTEGLEYVGGWNGWVIGNLPFFPHPLDNDRLEKQVPQVWVIQDCLLNQICQATNSTSTSTHNLNSNARIPREIPIGWTWRLPVQFCTCQPA